jgi:hypothetical protein
MTVWVHLRLQSSSDVTRSSFRLHERPLTVCMGGSRS